MLKPTKFWIAIHLQWKGSFHFPKLADQILALLRLTVYAAGPGVTFLSSLNLGSLEHINPALFTLVSTFSTLYLSGPNNITSVSYWGG